MCALSLSLVLPSIAPAAFAVGAYFCAARSNSHEPVSVGVHQRDAHFHHVWAGSGVIRDIFWAQDWVFCVRRQVKKRVLKTSLVARDRLAGVLQVPESGV